MRTAVILCRSYALPQVGGSPGADTDETAADSDDAEEAPAGQQQRQQQQQGGDAWTRGLDARWAAGEGG